MSFGNQFDQQHTLPPVSPDQFRQKLARRAGTEDMEQAIGEVVDEVWPVGLKDGEPVPRVGENADLDPSYRENQQEAVIELVNTLYLEDKDVAQLSAPTGAGKSLILYTTIMTVNKITNRKGFFTTPLNSLIDQIKDDPLIPKKLTIKGRNNYQCVHPEDHGTPVDDAICQRDDNFECELKKRPHDAGGCPYYGRRYTAGRYANLVTNLSFLMTNSFIPDEVEIKLPKRELLVVDECQSIDDFALSFVGFVLSDNIPIDWDSIGGIPPEHHSMEQVIEWVRREVLPLARDKLSSLQERSLKSIHESNQEEELERWIAKIQLFLSDFEDHHWTKTHNSFGGTEKIEFEPIFVDRFLNDLLWSQSNKVILSSATIPSGLLEETGLADKDVGRVEVPSSFPVERRPIITGRDVGKMTWKERDKTLPKMADEIARLADEWSGHKGMVHCHSYKIRERIYDRLPQDVKQRTRIQDPDDREASLEAWKKAPVDEEGPYSDTGGQVFLSVGMEEGVSLDDNLCRWQAVAKAAYPHMQDKRVEYRMDSDTMDGPDWTWYSSAAAIALQQAAGRGMRSKDDWCATYLLDSSLITLLNKNTYLFETWFMNAVDQEPHKKIRQATRQDPPDDGPTGNSNLDDIADQYFGD